MSQSNTNNDNEKLLIKARTWKIWYVMIVLYMLYFFDFATRAVISPMFPILKKDLGLSDSQLGWLSTVVLAMVGLLAIPLSYVIDRWRRGRMISLMSIVWSIASLFSGLSTNFSQLLITRGAMGVGEASFTSGGQAMIMAMIKKARRATVTGIWTTGTALGMAAGMALGGWVALNYGWRTAFMVVGIPGIIFGILAWFFPDYKSKPKDTSGTSHAGTASFSSTMKAILKNKTLITLFISYGLLYYFLTALIYWLPTYFNRYIGMDVALAGTMSGAVMLTALIASPIGGLIGDLVSRKKPSNKILLCWICIITSICCFACAVAFNIWPLFFPVAFFSFMYIPVQHTASQEVVPFYHRSTAYGVYMFCTFFLGGLWAPAVTGMISDASNLRTGFWVSGAVALIGFILYLVMWRFFDADYNNAKKMEQEVAVEST